MPRYEEVYNYHEEKSCDSCERRKSSVSDKKCWEWKRFRIVVRCSRYSGLDETKHIPLGWGTPNEALILKQKRERVNDAKLLNRTRPKICRNTRAVDHTDQEIGQETLYQMGAVPGESGTSIPD